MKHKRMKKIRTLKLNINLEVPFNEYNSERLNKQAESQIRRWVKADIKEHLAFIPIKVEPDETGAYWEDCTRETKVKVT